jgi:hypothetical protein
MRNAQALALLLALVAAAGCARPVWTKPGLTQAQFDRDNAECRYEATKHSADEPAAIWRKNELTMMCMELKGYTLTRGG